MAEKMLVTQALDERDLLAKKIRDKIEKIRLVDCKKRNEDKTVTDRVSAEEFAKNAESAYQQIMDLIDRYQRLESAIIASNASTYVETSRGRLSVAAAIALRNRLRISKEKEVNFEDILAFNLEEQERIKDELKGHKAEHKIKQRILYISDCHFYHDNLCRNLDHRGFIDFEEMNAFMIRQWNDNVNQKDDVYILGDFCFGNGEAAARIIKQLKGRLHLIIGNHDRFLHDRHFDRCLFKSIEAYSEISDKGRTVILSHYPVFCYKGQYRRNVDGSPATYMLYGHVHNTQDEQLVNRFIMQTRATAVKPRNADRPEPIPCNMINCFCMFSNYIPLTLDGWIKLDRSRRAALNQNDEVIQK